MCCRPWRVHSNYQFNTECSHYFLIVKRMPLGGFNEACRWVAGQPSPRSMGRGRVKPSTRLICSLQRLRVRCSQLIFILSAGLGWVSLRISQGRDQLYWLDTSLTRWLNRSWSNCRDWYRLVEGSRLATQSRVSPSRQLSAAVVGAWMNRPCSLCSYYGLGKVSSWLGGMTNSLGLVKQVTTFKNPCLLARILAVQRSPTLCPSCQYCIRPDTMLQVMYHISAQLQQSLVVRRVAISLERTTRQLSYFMLSLPEPPHSPLLSYLQESGHMRHCLSKIWQALR